MDKVTFFFSSEDGATAIEYALIASLIFLAIVSVMITLGGNLKELYYDRVLEAFPE